MNKETQFAPYTVGDGLARPAQGASKNGMGKPIPYGVAVWVARPRIFLSS